MTACQCCQRETVARVLANDIASVLGDESFIYTADLIQHLVQHNPEQWSDAHHFGRELTPQRLGRILSNEFGIKSTRDHTPNRGYCKSALEAIELSTPPRPLLW